MQPQIRWLIRRDMAEVIQIERACFGEYAWWEEDFLCCLRDRNNIGMVAEQSHRIVGFMVYRLMTTKLQLLNLAVAPDLWRQGIGAQMISRLVHKLTQQKRNEIFAYLRETNLSAQCFFAKNGFVATSVARGWYEDTHEDAFLMCYRLNRQKETGLVPNCRHNRIFPSRDVA